MHQRGSQGRLLRPGHRPHQPCLGALQSYRQDKKVCLFGWQQQQQQQQQPGINSSCEPTPPPDDDQTESLIDLFEEGDPPEDAGDPR